MKCWIDLGTTWPQHSEMSCCYFGKCLFMEARETSAPRAYGVTVLFNSQTCAVGPLTNSVMSPSLAKYTLKGLREIKFHFGHKLHVMLFVCWLH